MTGGFDRKRILRDLLRVGVLEHVRPAAVHEGGDGRQILPRVKTCLAAELHTGAIEEGNGVVKRGVEAEIGRERRLLLEPRTLLLGIGSKRRKLVAGNPFPAALDAFGADDPIDFRNGGEARIPGRLRMIPPKLLTSSERSRSVTQVRCAVVWLVSTPPARPRSITATDRPALFNRYAAVSPVIPAPMTTTSTVRFRSSAG